MTDTATTTSQYQTPEGGWVKNAPFWTVAYRKPRANRFLRVDLALTWDQARQLAGQLCDDTEGLEIYYTTTAEAERVGYTSAEDVGNLLVDSGRRVRILEGGTLPENTAAWLAALTTAAEPAPASDATETRVSGLDRFVPLTGAAGTPLAAVGLPTDLTPADADVTPDGKLRSWVDAVAWAVDRKTPRHRRTRTDIPDAKLDEYVIDRATVYVTQRGGYGLDDVVAALGQVLAAADAALRARGVQI